MGAMQASFDSILRRYGHNIYLQRSSQSTDGPITYSDILERHTVRWSIYNNRGLQNAQQEAQEGILNTTARVYYFKADVFPYEGDRIYEEEARPTDKKSVWTIESVAPMRGDNGKIIYFACGCGRISPN